MRSIEPVRTQILIHQPHRLPAFRNMLLVHFVLTRHDKNRTQDPFPGPIHLPTFFRFPSLEKQCVNGDALFACSLLLAYAPSASMNAYRNALTLLHVRLVLRRTLRVYDLLRAAGRGEIAGLPYPSGSAGSGGRDDLGEDGRQNFMHLPARLYLRNSLVRYYCSLLSSPPSAFETCI